MPQPVIRHGEKKIFIFRELESSPYVFLRHGAIRGPLQPPYDGPRKATQSGEKTYIIKVNNRDVTLFHGQSDPLLFYAQPFLRGTHFPKRTDRELH